MPPKRRASFSKDGVPTYLNVRGVLGSAEDWDDPEVPRLWRYNLHYFDDLNAEGANKRIALHRDLIQRWINENPPPVGTGWEPFPVSLRIVNWVKWSLAGNSLESSWEKSLAVQADWLAKNVEWHLLGNHLFANAKALVFAGLFFEGDAADRWLNRGLKILTREIPEQVLADGGQFERSPMYHAIAFEDILDLINISACWPGLMKPKLEIDLKDSAARMLTWLRVMCHPDGEIALFNDAAMGIAPTPDELIQYSERLGITAPPTAINAIHLADSGYVRAESDDAVLFVDVGEIGPDYLPGHAHADTLSFELSLFGHRCIVDSGCSTYEVSEERLRQRGTAAHNTVIVDDQDSSEVWSSFRVARRAWPKNVSVETEGNIVEIRGSHDGYWRLPGRVTHQRHWRLEDGALTIQDTLFGQWRTAVAHLLLHPDITAKFENGGVRLRLGDREVTVQVDGGQIEIGASTWHPEFGLAIPTGRLRIQMRSEELSTTIRWG